MIKIKKPNGKIEIDLTGPQGNAFHLIGVARDLSKKLGMDSEAITQEMMNGDYEHVIETMEKYFGHVVIMYRSL